MFFTNLVPALARPLLAVALITIGAGAAWQVQNWRYGAQLAEQARLHLQTLNQLIQASVTAEQTQREQRFVLEQRLYDNDQSNQRALSNAKQNQARLRDRLATADLRLSVLLAQPASRPDTVPAAATSSGMVYGAQRAKLDPAHAQRIISITDDGDQGLIALAACQGYAREIQSRYIANNPSGEQGD